MLLFGTIISATAHHATNCQGYSKRVAFNSAMIAHQYSEVRSHTGKQPHQICEGGLEIPEENLA